MPLNLNKGEVVTTRAQQAKDTEEQGRPWPLHVVGLEFADEVVAGGGAEGEVDEHEVVVHRRNDHGVAGPDDAGGGEGAGLGEGDFVGGSVDVGEVREGEGPLERRRPEVDLEGSRRVRRKSARRLRERRVHDGALERRRDGDRAEDAGAQDGGLRAEFFNFLLGAGVVGDLVLESAAQLVQLRADVEGVAREQQVVARVDGPGEADEQRRVHDHGSGHRQ
mmetsp:Transcript_14108/g.42673  ORF Transcript_14108/g.42673 Transcript_14108/m.42673 type:complete len:221 (-) Transcript_14108:164-826(-)